MYIATIDCGTTNTRVYIVDEKGNIVKRATKKVGVRDTAIAGNNKVLKEGVHDVFYQALEEANIKESEIRCILSSGMITSEIGLKEIPHLWAPCDLETLSANLTPYNDEEVFPASIPFYFVRGIKNKFDPATVSMGEVGTLDFMRGEEAQIAGLLESFDVKLPTTVIILSSHTKFIPIDEKKRILGSVTTLSGQLYEAILAETFVGKSVRAEDDFDDSSYFNPTVIEDAYRDIQQGGFLRCLMYVRFLDTLVHSPWYDRKLFAEALLASEDMQALHQVKELTGLASTNFILVGKTRRCRIYEYLMKKMIQDPALTIKIIDDDTQIDELSIQGVISLAKMAKLL
ncbi:MAG: 2-dehydro-3-deoxygalactonokinase [Methanobacterium sp.]